MAGWLQRMVASADLQPPPPPPGPPQLCMQCSSSCLICATLGHSRTVAGIALRGMWGYTGAHEAQERTQAPLQTNLISYSSHAEAPKEWFYYPAVAPPPSSPTEGNAHATCPPLAQPLQSFPPPRLGPLFQPPPGPRSRSSKYHSPSCTYSFW